MTEAGGSTYPWDRSYDSDCLKRRLEMKNLPRAALAIFFVVYASCLLRQGHQTELPSPAAASVTAASTTSDGGPQVFYNAASHAEYVPACSPQALKNNDVTILSSI
jgi:hypothetical protein